VPAVPAPPIVPGAPVAVPDAAAPAGTIVTLDSVNGSLALEPRLMQPLSVIV
jgi:hypothetical protein